MIRKQIVEANHKFRTGYMDAGTFLNDGKPLPDEAFLERVFKIKGESYKAGFMKRIQSTRKEEHVRN